ncbi:hydroxyacylglutathione hydrolase C-terminal domain-containing protein [Anaeromyxobacter sp. Fw109-5]|uniref:hydroxyacylglutathione hydrolase C-terminal domain-containing protein n=1 Tax=Anaeromyxobacter sp. (strain Fw109-5) TaxID=404589 RepID=UPI0000ED82B7|nr:hydroxyacylglutathione hydrolase C-terminal domain-containing protein [Anaeromyxobacter sp. Fw109-5]ABS26069.1 Hydroxyacylglutathione hydrolase [Anaeromyxobacter sp. Fw109-5]
MIFDRRRYHRDNYVYLLAEGEDSVLVDPGDAAVALALAADHAVRPRFVLHTHGHLDHSGGSAEVRAALGAEVLGHAADAAWFAPDRDVAGHRTLALGALRVAVHEVPGHTPGSVLFAWRGKLLTGDTLFWGGCGNCRHGGDPARLAQSFLGPIAALDGALEVHPGHDYAEANLPFALALEPGNAAARARLEVVERARAAGAEPPASTLAEEREVNPFLRVAKPSIRDAIAARSPEGGELTDAARFVALRALRDRL